MCLRAQRSTWSAIALTVGGAVTPVSVASERYEVVPLPDLGGLSDDLMGGVTCITDSGRAMGVVYDAEGDARAAVWDRNGGVWELTVVPSLGGGTRDIVFTGNAIGPVFGSSMHADGVNFHATQWVETDGSWIATDLGTLGGLESAVFGMNAGNLLAGGARDAGNLYHAVLWQEGVVQDLASIAGVHIVARGVNNIGQVVGGGYWRPDVPFLWLPEPAYGLDAGFNTLPTLGGDFYDVAIAVNDSGLICGFCFAPGDIGHPVLWKDGVLIDLAPGSDRVGWAAAQALNERNQVVGYTRTAADAEHGFIWEDGVLTDLNDRLPVDTGWIVSFPETINEAGWIGGWGRLDGGPLRPILLIPSCPATTGDLNGDGVVDVADLLILLANWSV